MSLNGMPEHISAVDAAKQFGYTNDYITRLAREKKIIAKRVGREWHVSPDSIRDFVAASASAKRAYAEKLREERRKERELALQVHAQQVASQNENELASVAEIPVLSVRLRPRAAVLAHAGAVLAGLALFVGTAWGGYVHVAPQMQQAGVFAALRELAMRVYSFGDEPENKNVPLKSGDEYKETAAVVDSATQNNSGMVVVPKEGADAREIARQFSDEVHVLPEGDGTSGVITPAFKNTSSTSYRYLMVPMNHSP